MNFCKKLKLYIPRPGMLTYSMTALQLFYSALFIKNKIPGYSFNPADLALIMFSLITVFLLSSVLELFTVNSLMRRIAIPFAVLVLWGLNAYQLSSGSPLDYYLVRDNIGISFSSEALTMISSPFSGNDLVYLAVFLAVTAFIEYRFTGDENSDRVTLRSVTASAALWILLVFIPVQVGDGLTLFAKSMLTGKGTDLYAGPVTSEYPYEKNRIARTMISSSVPSLKNKPNIILLMIESFNANFVEAKAPDGIDYTPNFNQLIKKGLYIERFYGNSIQTCKGQAAIFFSVLPSYKGKIFVDYPGLNIKGFPAILAGAGYETVFFQAFHNLQFDNTKDSMKKAGFSVIKSFAEYRHKDDKPYIWGWGVEDGVFYERFFSMLDKLHEKTPGKPVFASLMTIGTHIPCDGMPPERRTIYREPQNIKEKYSNALRLSDSQIPRFFELLRNRRYLENTIVIITADHSFPMREHGIYNNEVCFYDETFRIPFLILWDGVVKPERVRGRAYSQIDIGPTITDMLGLTDVTNTMMGLSVFDRKSIHPVYLIQPYNGRFLQVVNYPFKYISHLKTGREYLFNLEKDPSEKNNLVQYSENAGTIAGMKNYLGAVYLNQQLLDSDKIMKR